MKKLELSKATKPLADYARQVDGEAVMVVRNGKPVAVLSSAVGMDAESIALANNPRFAAIIAESRRKLEEEGGIPIEEVRRWLGIPRSRRKKRRPAR